MNSKFKMSIPKPCHENWNTMTPKEKGRFCSSCAKTVVDFTKKSTTEIQEYLVENKNQGVCGHFYRKQLDTLTIEIPRASFTQQLSFQKLFVLALFFAMGTSLFSCQYADGKKQKIDDVILVDTIKKVENEVDTLKILNKKEAIVVPKKGIVPPVPSTTGIFINIETSKKKVTCEAKKETSTQRKASITEPAVIEIMGDLVIEGEVDFKEQIEFAFTTIEEPPRFIGIKKRSKEKEKMVFDKQMKKFVQDNFDKTITQNLGLKKGKHRIHFLIVIDEEGHISDIKVRAPHPILKKEMLKILQKLPQFIPGKQGGKVVKTKYMLPISFIVE